MDDKILFVRSSKSNCSKSSGAESSANDDDIWDDSVLIKAYDKAVQLAQGSYLKGKQHSGGEANSKTKKKAVEQKWKVGDKCRCQYSEDLKYYEADIIDILGSTGMCVVRYVGYENEEKIPLKKLKQSEGESARVKQTKEALNENDDESNVEVENNSTCNTGRKSQPLQKKSSSGKKRKEFQKINGFSESNSFGSVNFSLPQIGNSIIPPPPPPHMFNRICEDEKETEAMSSMLISWYMSGYHTGFYQGLMMAKKQ